MPWFWTKILVLQKALSIDDLTHGKDKVSNKGPGTLDWRLPGCVLKCFLITLFCYLLRKLILINLSGGGRGVKWSGSVFWCQRLSRWFTNWSPEAGYQVILDRGRQERNTKNVYWALDRIIAGFQANPRGLRQIPGKYWGELKKRPLREWREEWW